MSSGIEVARAAHGAGFPDEDLVTAVAVAFAESSFHADATHRNSDGSVDYGLWQINSIHGFPELGTGAWRDPEVNAALALRVRRSQGWEAWSTFKPSDALGFARYTAAIPAAVGFVAAAGYPAAAAKGAVGTPGNVAEGIGGGVGDALSGAVAIAKEPLSVLRFLTLPDTWIRLAKIVVGGGLILAGSYLFVQSTLTKTTLGVAGQVIGIGGKVKTVKKAATTAREIAS